jgi:hypothetical protein
VQAADRPTGTSICDFYATGQTGASEAIKQQKLVNAVVSKAVLGDSGLGIEGIVNLPEQQPFFNSSINYRYTGGPNGASPAPNFLTDTTAFNVLANKLIGFFGSALGCSAQGTVAAPNTDFPAYSGSTDLSAVHRNMPISLGIFTQFNGQIKKTALALGVSATDADAIAALLATFNRGAFNADGTAAAATPKAATSIICNDKATCPCASAAYVGKQCKPAVTAPATRPATTTICDYYTAALGGAPSSAQDEYNLLFLIVSRAVLGGSGNSQTVEGIVNLPEQQPFFNSSINYRYAGSPNGAAAAPNFIADYGANGLTGVFGGLAGKLIGFFGSALGCSAQGTAAAANADFPAYSGSTDLTAIHKNMPITQTIFSQFNGQIKKTALSYGVAPTDADGIASLLATFNRGGFNADGSVAVTGSDKNIICNDAATCPCASADYMSADGCKANSASSVAAFSCSALFAIAFAMMMRQ